MNISEVHLKRVRDILRPYVSYDETDPYENFISKAKASYKNEDDYQYFLDQANRILEDRTNRAIKFLVGTTVNNHILPLAEATSFVELEKKRMGYK
jgi:hypothetical protein